ncbi:SusC/RagA family TonB-linked outer membrane protein [Gracilimonas mengyeensis]|uniref:TonB-linked outer membrane protein, SusC/RagA family n=1 Tax=Gracilimonas mengyeensis TaxID=1302730 RepID=A0A521BTJ4_9BACT|nr:TonB-dependent receptor [Gracilimonas mengyeensis]SMO50473.1 TonB-linked outer membrane protein, SusC/RagA family [Gracilimonas mengyeensis]
MRILGNLLFILLVWGMAVDAHGQDSENSEITVTGRVTDSESGETLPGVNIVIKGTLNGTTTNLDGEFTLRVPGSNTILVFSYVGFETQEITVGSQEYLDVKLVERIGSLSEVVVVGYGTQRRMEVTSSISSVPATEIAQQTTTNLNQALQGRVAGVNITQNSGAPGAGISVDVRGIGTIGNSSPLYVIDGIPGGDINSINPQNIKSIEILKDASAAAIYGANGANGVVLVTTKGGTIGEAQIDFDMTRGIQQLSNKMDMLNAEQYARMQNEARAASGLETYWDNPSSLGKGTDWQDELSQNAVMQKYNLSVSGGTEDLQYFVSGGYYDQEGVLVGSGFERGSIQANADYKINDYFKIGNRLSLARTNQASIPEDYPFATDNRIVGALEMSPTVPVFRDGQYAGPLGDFEGSSQGPNPVGLAVINDVENKVSNVVNRAYIEITPIENLIIKSELGVDYTDGNYFEFNPTYRWGITSSSIAQLYRGSSNSFGWTSQTTARYQDTFKQYHDVNFLAGFSVSESRYESIDASAQGFISEKVRVLSAADQINSLSEFVEEEAMIGYFGRINYAFDSKYLFTGNVRVDGSSKFGEGNRYGVFPSFSVGWRLSEEQFLSDINALDDLKLRVSWGKSGNSQIGNYNYATRLNLSQYYVFGSGQEIVPGVAPNSVPNKDVKWETTTQTNIGVDLALFQDKINFTADYFIKNTTDMLVPVPIPSSSGITEAPYQNAGEIENKGLEIAMFYQNSVGDFYYKIGGNFSAISNEVLDLGGGLPVPSPILYRESVRLTRTEKGRSVGEFYGYKTDGIFQNQSEVDSHADQPGAAPGDIRFVDVNGDGVINDSDRTYIGSPIPDFQYGINANFSYKNFDLNMLFSGVQGNKLMNTMGYRLLNGSHIGNKMAGVLDRWTGPGTSNEMPRLTWNDPNDNARISDRYVEDGSYFRLKNILLAYNLSESMLEKIGARSARIFVSARNLFTITDYSGFDPELGKVDNNNLNYGIDMGNYPVPRSFNIGVSLGL